MSKEHSSYSLNQLFPSVMMGLIAGVDNLAAALAFSAILFTGPLTTGMGLSLGVILLGGAVVALFVALRSQLPNSVALVQESTIAILAIAISTMVASSSGSVEEKIATAIAIIGITSLVTGAIFCISGRLRLGGMVRFMPFPVVAGFFAGTGWMLIESAALMLTGHGVGTEFLLTLRDQDTYWRVVPAAGFGITLLLVLNRFSHPVVMPLFIGISLAGFFTVQAVLGIDTVTLREAGHLPQTNFGAISLPTPELLTLVDWWQVLLTTPSMLVIAALSMISFMLNVSGLELALGRDVNVNTELRSTGVANIFSGGIGGPIGFTGLSMTALAEKTGATGRGPGFATALVMLAGLFFFGSLAFYVPPFITGGFALFLGLQLIKEWLLDNRLKLPLSEWLIVIVILLTVAILGFTEGLAVGLVVSSGLFVFRYSRLPVIRQRATGVERRSSVDRSPGAVHYLSEHGGVIEIIQLQGYLFFGTADRVVSIIRDRVADTEKPPIQYLILDFKNVSGADSAAVAGFVKINRLLHQYGIRCYFSCLPDDLQQFLQGAGINLDGSDLISLEEEIDLALEKAEEALLGEDAGIDVEANLLHHFRATIGDHPRLEDLIDAMTHLHLEPEEVLIRQGDSGEDIYFVARGRVRVQIELPDGRPLRVRAMLGGAIVGEIAHYLNQSRSADVIVDAPSDVFCLSAGTLQRLEKEDPEIAVLAHRILATTLSEKLSVANRTLQLAQR